METLAEERVLVLMPTTRDGQRTGEVLAAAGLDCVLCTDIARRLLRDRSGAGAALLTEEAIEGDRGGRLREALKSQPPWSDFPLVVLAREGAEDASIRESMNATLVERPLKVRSLLERGAGGVAVPPAAVRGQGPPGRATEGGGHAGVSGEAR